MKRLIAVLAAAVIFAGCAARPERYGAVYTDLFDTVTEFTAYCSSREEFDRLSGICYGELKRLHEIFDIYSESETYGAASLNAGKEGDCPAELYELTEQGINWHSLTGGRLNIALGSVLSLWHDCREKGILPDPDELRSRAGHCDIGKIKLEGGRVRLEDPEMSLDFGAVAKGYSAQKTAELLINSGAESFALNVGGNVITYGEKPSGKWEIGIESPDGGIFTTVKVAGECVVTSGDYQRWYEVDGVRYHHIIDTETLYPAALWRSVTVITDDSAEADALSTALFCMPYDDGRALAEKFGAEVLWISPDGEAKRTEGFSDYE